MRARGAIDAPCEFTQEMLRNLEWAVKHEDVTKELAEVFSTPVVEMRARADLISPGAL